MLERQVEDVIEPGDAVIGILFYFRASLSRLFITNYPDILRHFARFVVLPKDNQDRPPSPLERTEFLRVFGLNVTA